MGEKLLLLERTIEEDLVAIDRLFARLEGVTLDRDTSEETRVVVGYQLHNLYNAFENIFRSVARTFENTLDEREAWYAELLRRMRLNLLPVRPAVIDAVAFDLLNELRGFRHVFRSLYSTELDPLRMNVTLVKALELKEIWPAQIARFMDFLAEQRELAD